MMNRQKDRSPREGGASKAGRALLVAGGSVLTAVGLKRLSPGGAVLAAAGAALVYRGVRSDEEDARGIFVERALTIVRPRDEVYAFWRDLKALPTYMEHIAEVALHEDGRSTWTFDVPGSDRRVQWEAEIVRDEPGRVLSWRSLPGGDIETEGEVRFEDAPHPSSTELYVRIRYRPPAGEAGRLAAKLINPAFDRLVREDVRRVKHVLEAGEIPTTAGQPSARRAPTYTSES